MPEQHYEMTVKNEVERYHLPFTGEGPLHTKVGRGSVLADPS